MSMVFYCEFDRWNVVLMVVFGMNLFVSSMWEYVVWLMRYGNLVF